MSEKDRFEKIYQKKGSMGLEKRLSMLIRKPA